MSKKFPEMIGTFGTESLSDERNSIKNAKAWEDGFTDCMALVYTIKTLRGVAEKEGPQHAFWETILDIDALLHAEQPSRTKVQTMLHAIRADPTFQQASDNKCELKFAVDETFGFKPGGSE